ncbi:MAG TPA: PhzF family phenazine biosynthesis protein [Ktedonobacterales bacterium]|nr:PhzF family phenazine biosynthesis protein [Ktedonobacterales bacterium]
MSERTRELEYRHVDVFTQEPLSGNGLIVFPDAGDLTSAAMQRITQEMRQFESIFLTPTSDANRVGARVFTMEEELPFAGHPVLGAACVLHERLAVAGEREEWTIALAEGPVKVTTTRRGNGYEATMDQGRPSFGATLGAELAVRMLTALNLKEEDLHPGLPLQIVSTGLPYLLVMLASGLERAAIVQASFDGLLAQAGAKFVYVFHVATREGRTWDNDGRVEDIATGSAAGPVGAYLVRYGHERSGAEIVLHQGRFVGRPSRMLVRVDQAGSDATSVRVTGEVRMVARGAFDADVSTGLADV